MKTRTVCNLLEGKVIWKTSLWWCEHHAVGLVGQRSWKVYIKAKSSVRMAQSKSRALTILQKMNWDKFSICAKLLAILLANGTEHFEVRGYSMGVITFGSHCVFPHCSLYKNVFHNVEDNLSMKIRHVQRLVSNTRSPAAVVISLLDST